MHGHMNVKYEGFLNIYVPSDETYGTLSESFIYLLKLTNLLESTDPTLPCCLHSLLNETLDFS
jgi:hypothetical protein